MEATKKQIEEFFKNKNSLLSKWAREKAQELEINIGDCYSQGDGYLWKVLSFYAEESKEYLYAGWDPCNSDIHYELKLYLVVEDIQIDTLEYNPRTNLSTQYLFNREKIPSEEFAKAKKLILENAEKIKNLKDKLSGFTYNGKLDMNKNK